MVAKVLMKSAIKHPQAPQGARKSGLAFWGREGAFSCGRGAQWRGCGNRTATIDAGVQRRHGAKRSGYERETAGEKYESAPFSGRSLI